MNRRQAIAAAGLSALAAGASEARAKARPAKAGLVTTPPDAVVETAAGKVRGSRLGATYVYKGIVYGKAARFMPATPAPAWTGVKTALAYGPVCPQGARSGWAEDETAFIYDWDDGFHGEDCQRLNLWTPGLAGKRPVMVWIHGGGYETGSSQELPAYDGERLSLRGDLVVVSVNHRLGPFGFMDLSEHGRAAYARSGNVGMTDLILALQWVRENISRFGGDPGQVTIFGQSGGGAKVSTLMAMPAAKGLFHRAIVQSGSQLAVAGSARRRAITAEVMKQAGLAPTAVADLAALPAARLVAVGRAAQLAMPSPPGTPIADGLYWAPFLDGADIPAQTWEPGAPALSQGVPLMVGTTRHEFSLSLSNGALEAAPEPMLKALLAGAAGAKAASAWDAFKAAAPSAKPVDIASRIVAGQFRLPAVAQARLKAAAGGAGAFLYRFDWETPVLDGRPRAFHCAELAFCFDNIDRCLNATGGGPEARALAAQIADAWIAFARTGDPNHRGLPKWPAVKPGALPTMLFNTRCEVRDDPDRAERAALGE